MLFCNLKDKTLASLGFWQKKGGGGHIMFLFYVIWSYGLSCAFDGIIRIHYSGNLVFHTEVEKCSAVLHLSFCLFSFFLFSCPLTN